MRKDDLRYFLVFLALVMWALSFPSLKVVLDEVEPLTLASLRFLIAIPPIFLFYLHETKLRNDRGGGESSGSTGSTGTQEPAVDQEKARGPGAGWVSGWVTGWVTGWATGLRTGWAAGLKTGWARELKTMTRGLKTGQKEAEDPDPDQSPSTSPSRLTPKEKLFFIAFSLFNVVFPNIFQNYGMQSVGSGVTSIIQGSGPIFTLILAMIFLGERMNRQQMMGVALAFIGSFLLVTGGRPVMDGSTIGKILILLSAVSYAISGVLAKKLLKKMFAAEIVFKSFLVGGTLLALMAIFIEGGDEFTTIGFISWQHILFLALLPTCVAYIFWYRAMMFLPLSKLSITVFLIPVMAVVFSFAFLGELLEPFHVVTGAMVIVGVVVAQIGGRGENEKSKENVPS